MTRDNIVGTLQGDSRLSGGLSVGGGTTDYNELENKPTYNGHIIEGDMTNETLGIWQPKNFSTTEQNTGIKWIDGKDIYHITIEFNTEIIASYTSWTPVTMPNLPTYYDTFINNIAINSVGVNWGACSIGNVGGNICVQTDRNGDTIGIKFLTVFYTKN